MSYSKSTVELERCFILKRYPKGARIRGAYIREAYVSARLLYQRGVCIRVVSVLEGCLY